MALFGGETGFELYDRIVADAPRVLRPGGWLIMELGFGSLIHVQGVCSRLAATCASCRIWRAFRGSSPRAGN